MMIETGLASVEDIDAIAEIEFGCAENPWTKKQLLDELSLPYAKLLFALCDGELAGFCSLHIVVDDGHINELGVKTEKRRRGVGKALVSRAVSLCRESECSVVSLEVRSKNSAAAALYRSCGFEECGVRRNFYQNPCDDAINMIIYLNGSNG